MRSGGYEQVKGFLGFTKRFPDEQSCRDFLFERRWPNGFACPACGGVEYYFIKTRELFESLLEVFPAELQRRTVRQAALHVHQR